MAPGPSCARRPILRRIGMGSAIDKLWRVSEDATGLKIGV